MATKQYFKRKTSSGYEVIYPYTDANAVAETSDRVFITSVQKTALANLSKNYSAIGHTHNQYLEGTKFGSSTINTFIPYTESVNNASPQYVATFISNNGANGLTYSSIADLLKQLAEATSTLKGLMSATDKSKLDGIESGANKTTIDDVFNANSTNPVQNKIVTAAHTTTQNSINNLSGTKADKASAIKSIALTKGNRTLVATMADGSTVTIGTIDILSADSGLETGGTIGQVLEEHDRMIDTIQTITATENSDGTVSLTIS